MQLVWRDSGAAGKRLVCTEVHTRVKHTTNELLQTSVAVNLMWAEPKSNRAFFFFPPFLILNEPLSKDSFFPFYVSFFPLLS